MATNSKRTDTRLKSAVLTVALVGLLGGCATSGNPKDPIEGYNRAMYGFNEAVDTVLIKPVAQGYDAVLPAPVRTGVTNFFGNIADLFIGVNNLFQGKPDQAASDLGRVLINSTIGILGLFDVATEAGLEKHEEDFGQTFGRWGVGNGAYVVLPIFGPRTVRDTAGL
ncbi:MAG: VacJ family lipoprotein, partial [Rhodocyclaceae bacterium]|nr:VacJ family lipoprotein [Rhodocyclaceae bacterium]